LTTTSSLFAQGKGTGSPNEKADLGGGLKGTGTPTEKVDFGGKGIPLGLTFIPFVEFIWSKEGLLL